MAQNTVELITEAFDNHNIKYRIVELDNLTFVDAGYSIPEGPTVRFHFLSQGSEGNDVQVRVNGILNKVSKEKRAHILEACNRINSEMRYYKFYLDQSGNLFGQADLPVGTAEERVGENSYELMVRGMQILDRCYHYFPEAYYSVPSTEKKELLLNTLNALQNLRDHPMTISSDEKDEN